MRKRFCHAIGLNAVLVFFADALAEVSGYGSTTNQYGFKPPQHIKRGICLQGNQSGKSVVLFNRKFGFGRYDVQM